MTGLAWQLTGDLVAAGHLVSVLAGSALVIPVYILARDLYGTRTARYAALFTAIFPLLVYGSVETFSESLYTFLLLAGISVFWWSFSRRRFIGLPFAGALIGLSFLTHPSGLAFLPLLLLFFLWEVFPPPDCRGRLYIPGGRFRPRFQPGLPSLLDFHPPGDGDLAGERKQPFPGFEHEAGAGPGHDRVGDHLPSHGVDFSPGGLRGTKRGNGDVQDGSFHPFEFMEIVRYNLEDGYHEIGKTAFYLGMNVRLLAMILGAVVVGFIFFFLHIFRRRREFLSGLFLLRCSPPPWSSSW